MKPLVYSFFSGAGGLDLGFQQAGYNVAIAQDINADCVSTLSGTGQYRATFLGDVRDNLDYQAISFFNAMRDGQDLFALIGGPPCQSFSTAGKMEGFEDARGSLIDVYLSLVSALSPRFFVLENVPNLLTIKHDATSERGSAIKHIERSVARMGYTLTMRVMSAELYGAPQKRQRLILVGSRDDEEFHFPVAQPHVMTLREAIADLETCAWPEVCTQFSERQLKFLKHVPAGGNWRDIPDDLKPEAMGAAMNPKTAGGMTGFYRRLAYDKPSPTLVTSPTQRATMLCHPTQDRPLSVLEYARIQGFPDDYTFAGTLSSRYRQIGNAVPVPLARAIAQALLATAQQRAA